MRDAPTESTRARVGTPMQRHDSWNETASRTHSAGHVRPTCPWSGNLPVQTTRQSPDYLGRANVDTPRNFGRDCCWRDRRVRAPTLALGSQDRSEEHTSELQSLA